jgi:DNA-binding NarL/FixJ family response regulator
LAAIRILLAELPQMRREIIAGVLGRQADMEVVGEVPVGALPTAVARERADVLVIGFDRPSLVAELMERRPRLKVLAVADEGRDCSLYALRPERADLGEASPQQLVETIRDAVGGRTASWPSG